MGRMVIGSNGFDEGVLSRLPGTHQEDHWRIGKRFQQGRDNMPLDHSRILTSYWLKINH